MRGVIGDVFFTKTMRSLTNRDRKAAIGYGLAMMANRARRFLWRCETALALSLSWLLVFALPFRWTAAMIGGARQSASLASTPDGAALRRAFAVTRRLNPAGRDIPFTPTCLVRAVAGWLLLKRRGINPTIRFGVAVEGGKLAAHAWLILGDETLIGGNEAPGFHPLADLGG
jgi:hypothetical protein